jgi:hypothetical protein
LTGAGSGKFEIAGAGDKKASFTDPADIASFTAYVLTHLPPSELANKAFRIEGESASFLDIAGYYGSKVTVEHVGGFPGDEFRTFLQKLINSGNGALGDDPAGLSNGLYAGHSFKGIKEGLGL